MQEGQLTIFKQRLVGKAAVPPPLEPAISPTGESSIMQTLPAYLAHLSQRYAAKTVRMYWGDIRALSIYLRDTELQEIRPLDLEQWSATLVTGGGRNVERKTLNRKVSAVINYFAWLRGAEVISGDPAATLMNARVQSPLPDYIYETEVRALYDAASQDPRTYLLVLLLLETGMKSMEMLTLARTHVDISNRYRPELWIKHTGKATKKDRKVALPAEFPTVYVDYLKQYDIMDVLFPFSDRFLQLLFADLKKQTGNAKALTPKTLRHTHVVRAYRRGEHPEQIFDRIGLAPDSRAEAHQMYSRLAAKAI